MRLAGLGDRRWVHGLLERADRVRHGAWRLDLNFIAVCYGTLHRRHLLCAIRAKLRSPTFHRDIDFLLRLTAGDFGAVANIISDTGGLKEALASDLVAARMKELLR